MSPSADTLSGDPARYPRGLKELGSGVWGWIQPNGGWGEANAGLIAGGERCLLVDTLWDQRLAREMLAVMDPVRTGKPIAHVFNTHSDGDHWWGNRVVPAEAEILTTDASRRTMDIDGGPHELARLTKVAGVAARVPGPLRAGSAYLHRMLSPFDFAGVEPRFPDRTFSGEHTIDLGGREVHLIEVGPAHTPGDAIVHMPDAGVAFGADVLFFGASPVMWFGPLENWIAALDTLLSLDADTYLPGHGPAGTRDDVQDLRDYMSWLGELVGREHAAGHSAPAAAHAAVRAPEFARWRNWILPERMLITIDTIHRNLSGQEPVGVSTRGRAMLFNQVGAFAKELNAG